jgi:hypothetical protein
MGYIYGRTDSYAIGLWMLAVTAALTLALTVTVVRRTERLAVRAGSPVLVVVESNDGRAEECAGDGCPRERRSRTTGARDGR